MPLYRSSRYLKVNTVDITASDNENYRVYELMQTTIDEEDLPEETEWYSVGPDETFESIASREYYEIGGANVAWVLAMCNPEIFYPLDLTAGDRVRLPPSEWIERFIGEVDDWEYTWRSVIR